MLQRFCWSVAAWCICAGMFAFGQTNFATLSGRVSDSQSLPVRDARIELRSQSTDATRTGTLNGEGLFEFPAVPPGDYTVDVQAPGFASLHQQVRLEVGQQMRIDLTLTLGNKVENLDVVARTEILKDSRCESGRSSRGEVHQGAASERPDADRSGVDGSRARTRDMAHRRGT